MGEPRQFVPEAAEPDIAIPALLKPLPTESAARVHIASGTEARVCHDIARRQALGIRKYGTTVADNPLPHRQWLQHAYEEALDLAIYLKRSIEQLQADGTAPR